MRTGPDRVWVATKWGLRLLVLGFAVASWQQFDQGQYEFGLVYAALSVLCLPLQYVAHRLALGWITDGRGERQKVEHWNRGTAIYQPASRDQRIIQEGLTRSARRQKLFWFGVTSIPLAYVIYLDIFQHYAGGWIYPFTPLAAVLLACFLWQLFFELVYLSGYQDMEGAKVFDRPVPQPGLQEVTAQKVHGDARAATEDEAHAILNPNN